MKLSHSSWEALQYNVWDAIEFFFTFLSKSVWEIQNEHQVYEMSLDLWTSPGNRRESASHHIIGQGLHKRIWSFHTHSKELYNVMSEALSRFSPPFYQNLYEKCKKDPKSTKCRWDLRTSPGNRRESASHHVIGQSLYNATWSFHIHPKKLYNVISEALSRFSSPFKALQCNLCGAIKIFFTVPSKHACEIQKGLQMHKTSLEPPGVPRQP